MSIARLPIFSGHRILPRDLRKTYNKLQARADKSFLFDGKERQKLRREFLSSVFILLGFAAIGIVIIIEILSLLLHAIPSLLEREMSWTGILQEIWVLLLLTLVFLLLLWIVFHTIIHLWHDYRIDMMIMNTHLIFSKKVYPLGEDVKIALRRKVQREDCLAYDLDIWATLHCVEVVKNKIGTEDNYVCTSLWSSETQNHTMTLPISTIEANFSFRLPRADSLDPMTYQSTELIKTNDDATYIAWIVEVVQKSEELGSHFLIPIKVQA